LNRAKPSFESIWTDAKGAKRSFKDECRKLVGNLKFSITRHPTRETREMLSREKRGDLLIMSRRKGSGSSKAITSNVKRGSFLL